MDELRTVLNGTAVCGPRQKTVTPDQLTLPTQFGGTLNAFLPAGPGTTPPGGGRPLGINVLLPSLLPASFVCSMDFIFLLTLNSNM